MGIYRLLVDPTTDSTIYALDFNMQVWISLDAGESWNQLPGSPPSPAQADTHSGAVMTLASDGTLWIASQGGLAKLPPPLIGSTWTLDNPNPFSTACTDVVIGRDGTVYAAIQGDEVFRRQPNQTQWEAINTGETIVHKPMRLAVGQNTIVLNADQDIYTHSISTTTWNDWVCRASGVVMGRPATPCRLVSPPPTTTTSSPSDRAAGRPLPVERLISPITIGGSRSSTIRPTPHAATPRSPVTT